MAEEFRVSIGLELKSDAISGLQNQISKIQANPIKLSLDTSNVQNQINSMAKQIQSLDKIKISMGGTTGSNDVKKITTETNTAYKDLLNLQRRISQIKLKIGGLDSGKNTAQIRELNQQLQALMADYDTLKRTMGEDLSTTQWGTLQSAIDETKEKLQVLDSKVADTKQQISDGIALKLNTNEFMKDISIVENNMSKLKVVNDDIKSSFTELNTSLSSMQTAQSAGDVDRLVASYKQYESVLKNVNNQITAAVKSEQIAMSGEKLIQQRIALTSQMDIWLRSNSAAAKDFGSSINHLKAELQSCDATQLNGIKSQFQEITRQAQLAGKSTKTFGDTFKDQLSTLSSFFSAAAIISQTMIKIREMYQNVVSVDTSLTGLYRVTSLTSDGYSKMYSEMISSAKAYGATLTSIIDLTTDWVKLGFDPTTSQRLSEITTMYQHVTDLDTSTATKNLVTAYKGFQDQLENLYDGDSVQAIEYVADIFDRLGNEYSVSAADVGEALTKCASVMDIANNSIQETAAMATGITEVIQNADIAGSTLKILSMRLRGTTATELEAIGEDTEGLIESTGALRDTIKDLAGIDIMIDDTTFKSTYQIMSEIAEVYDKLSDASQAHLLETIAGKNRAAGVAALISNWEQVESAAKAAYNAEGTAAAENEIYMKSLQGHLDILTASWQALSNTVINSEFVKVLISGLTGVLDTLDTLIGTLGSIPTLLTAISGVMAFKDNGFIKLNTEAEGFLKKIEIANVSLSGLFKKSITSSDVADIQAYNAQIEKGATAQTAFYRTMQSSSDSAKDLVASTNGAKVSQAALDAATKKTTLSTIALKTATMALNIAITAGLTFAISALISGISKLINAQKEARQIALEKGRSVKEESESLQELLISYNNLSQAVVDDASQKDKLESVTAELLSALGKEESQIDSLTDKYKDLDSAINHISTEVITDQLSTLYPAINAAEKELLKKTKDGFFSTYARLSGTASSTADFLADAGYISSGSYNKMFEIYLGDTSTLEGTLEVYQQLIEMKQLLMEANQNGDLNLSAEELASDDLFNAISSKLNDMKEYIEEYQDLIDTANTLQASLRIQTLIEEDDLPQTVDEYNAYRDKVIQDALNSGDYFGTELDITNAFDSIMSEMDQFADFADDRAQQINNSIHDIKKSFAESSKIKSVPWKIAENDIAEFNNWIDSLASEDQEIVYKISIDKDTAEFSLQDWISEIEAYREELRSLNAISFSALMAEKDTDAKDGFSTRIDNYVDQVNSLQEALANYKKGDFKNTDLIDLIKTFPQLAGQADNLDSAINNLLGDLNANVMADFADQFNRLDTEEDVRALEEFMEAVLELGAVVGSTEFSIDIDAEVEGMDNLYKAMKESTTSTGLTADSVSALKARYQDLANYNPAQLFEKTANGVHLNTKALRELETTYEKQTKALVNNNLAELVSDYNNLAVQIANCSDAAEKADLYKQQSKMLALIEDTAMAAAQFEGLTSAFYKWEQAQSNGEEGDMYDSLAGSLEDIGQLYEDGLIGTNAFRTAVQLMSNEDLSTASIDQLIAAYEAGYPKMQRYFTDSSDGCLNFLHDLKNLNSEWVTLNDDESWTINFGVGNDQEIADALGVNVETIQSIMRKLSDYGFDINLDSIFSSLDYLGTEAEKANDKLIQLGETDVIFNFDTTDIDNLNAQIEEAQNIFNKFVDSETGKINLEMEGAEEAQFQLMAIETQLKILEQPTIMAVDTGDAETDIVKVVGLLQDFQSGYDDLTVKANAQMDTEKASANVASLYGQIQELEKTNPEIVAELSLDTSSEDALIASIANISNEQLIEIGCEIEETAVLEYDPNDGETKTLNIETEVNRAGIDEFDPNDGEPKILTIETEVDTTAVDEYEADDKEATVVFGTDTSAPDKYVPANKSATVKYNIDTSIPDSKNFNRTATITYTSKGGAQADGTAHAQGTAFAHGNWGTRTGGTALGGELGPEILVRNGRYITIGEESAEFFNYQKGDIIFNAEQTRQILEKGKITSGRKRGAAYASGTIEGPAFSSGSGKITASGKVKTTPSGSSSSNNKTSSNSAAETTADEFEEIFDWIEIAIDRIERAITRLDLKASSVYKSWSSRNSNLKKEITEVNNEISLQQKAYDRYIKQANSVGLSSEWADKVKNGTVDISTITDETLANQINEFSEWYEKALSCLDAIDQLNETVGDLHQTAFDNVLAQYDSILAVIQHEQSILNEYITQAEANGHIISGKYYEALIKAEKDNINQLQKEKSALVSAMNDAVNSGSIEKGSEAWNEMARQIDDVTLALEQANTALIEYNNSIRDINWQVYDLLQTRISHITQEADFLIDLLSSKDLHDDRGQLTDIGMSTMALYGLNYNTYMAQADKYAEEMLRIEKELATDQYNQTLIDRKQELLELQQESILAAESEKQAIVSMVKEGIELELSALKELISTYTDALDAQKSLYDFQKKVAKQTKEIASIQKQLAAYANDTSEETRSKVQQLKVSLETAQDNLEETQYERFISDQKKLLNDLYDEYETVLNTRLDDIDALMLDMITEINNNAELVSSTIAEQTDLVGYTITDSMASIWDTSTNNITTVLSMYGDDFGSKLTTVNSTLSSINTNIQSMLTAINKSATTDTSTASGSATTKGGNSSSTSSNANNSSTNSSSNSSSGSSSSTKSVGDFFISKKDSYPKSKLNISQSIVDRLKFNDFDSSFSARKTYYTKMGLTGTYTGSSSQNVNMLNWLKQNGYRNGVYNLSQDEMAWTQEGFSPEAIIRPSDGAILTPLAQGDSVLNASATSNLFDFANSPEDFIRKLSGNSYTAIPQSSATDLTTNNNFNLQLNLPSVTNYDQFIQALKTDKQIEKIIQAMTTDRLAGGSALKKHGFNISRGRI